jgi:hypothetical protein
VKLIVSDALTMMISLTYSLRDSSTAMGSSAEGITTGGRLAD